MGCYRMLRQTLAFFKEKNGYDLEAFPASTKSQFKQSYQWVTSKTGILFLFVCQSHQKEYDLLILVAIWNFLTIFDSLMFSF